MPGDPEQCRLNTVRCLKLAERAKAPARRESLAALAKTWTRLAAEFELNVLRPRTDDKKIRWTNAKHHDRVAIQAIS